ncbi:hypothetical protein HPB47_002323 [Ixodes persulcatus]|uniref:Uncharacterized protein n=1 Tax=Ixodes persulcatus TaxID=34615 RepID=A0AC60PMG3_IXOPE|nr:hypothetical protein HPB47_002323 [Ixodes persulcatus]
MPEATALFEYLQSVDLADEGPEERFVDTTVYTAKELNEEIQSRMQSGNPTPLTGSLYALLNHFDLDGPGVRLISSRCGHCNFRLRQGQVCSNGTCPTALGQADPSAVNEIDIPVIWTDHTGTVIRSRISGHVADNLLGVTVVSSLLHSNRMCHFPSSGIEPMVRVVKCEHADPKEFLERVFNRF